MVDSDAVVESQSARRGPRRGPTCVPCRFLLRWGWTPGGHDGFMSFRWYRLTAHWQDSDDREHVAHPAHRRASRFDHPARPSANPTCQRMARQWFRWAGIMSSRDSVCARKAFVCAIAEPRRSIVKQLLHLFSQKLPTEPADPRQGFLLFLIVLLCGNTRRTSAWSERRSRTWRL